MRTKRTPRIVSGAFRCFVVALGLAVMLPMAAEAQVLKKLKDKAKQTIAKEAALNTEELLANALRCVHDDSECIEEAKAEGKPVVLTDTAGTVLRNAEGEPLTDPAELTTEQAAVGDRISEEIAVPPVENGAFSLVVSPWSDLNVAGSAIASVRATHAHEPGDSTAIVRFCYGDRHGQFHPINFDAGEWVLGQGHDLALVTFDAERELNFHFFGVADSVRLERSEEGYLTGVVRGTVVPLVGSGRQKNAQPKDRQDFILAFRAEARHPTAPDGAFGEELNCPQP